MASPTGSPISAELELAEPVDVIFSTATFHWIADHERLFQRLRAALAPGGRLGGAMRRARATSPSTPRRSPTVAARPEFAAYLDDIAQPWNFAAPAETERRLHDAGFSEARCWLEPKPVTPERPLEFISTVTVVPHLAQLPEELRRPFAEAVLERSGEPLTLNYVRLNIEARIEARA